MPGGFVTVRYVGGSHDGAVRPLPEEDAVLGYPLPLPPRDRYAAPDTDPPTEPVVIAPDSSWERYVLRHDAEGWLFEYVGHFER